MRITLPFILLLALSQLISCGESKTTTLQRSLQEYNNDQWLLSEMWAKKTIQSGKSIGEAQYMMGLCEFNLQNVASSKDWFEKAATSDTPEVKGKAMAMLGIIGMILALASKYLGPGWEEKVEGKTTEQIRDWMEAENLVVGGLFAVVFGILFKSPWAGFATGVTVVEGLEAGMGPDWTSEEQTEENQKVLGAYAVKALSELNIFASKLRDAV